MITWEKLRAKMREKGWTSYYVRKHNIMGFATYNRIMADEPINTKILDRFCNLLDCSPEDIITYRKDSEE